MSKRANQRQKVLALRQLLLEQTDPKHPMPVATVIEQLNELEIPAERKSLYADFTALQEFGLDVRYRGGVEGGWYVNSRVFHPAELKLLVDAVQASRFVTKRKSRLLIDKLLGLSSVHEAKQLKQQVYVERRVKASNESIYQNVDQLHEAIQKGLVIEFCYFDYNWEKKKILRHNGRKYHVSPKGLLLNHENYYLAGYDHRHRELRHYRVDKMQEITLTTQRQETMLSGNLFDTAQYSNKLFGMYRGKETMVHLRCLSDLAGVILDRFGMDTILTPDGDDYFIATVEVAVSPPFWGWLFTMGEKIELRGPLWAVQIYKQRLRDVLRLHGASD